MTIDFMLAKEYMKGMPSPKSDQNCIPPIGWIVSEKYDGYRARWMGETNHVFLSRAQKEFSGAPEWYKLAMPEENLDGELWVGRENFQSMGVVRKKVPNPEEWIPVKYLVYDIPDLDKPFSERLVILRKIVKENKARWDEVKKTLPEELQIECPLKMAPQKVIESEEQMEEIYRTIIEKGGEGVMLKDPDSFYENKRSNYLLKYKPSFDEEAIIVDYKLGKGKYTGILGGFICKPLLNMDTYHLIDKDEQHEFSISGMDDEVRNEYKETHPIGTIISYEHSGKTDSGKPRFARYMRKREDITVKEEIENPCTEKKKNILFILKKLADHEKANGEAFKANSYLKVISELKKLKDDSDFTEATIRGIKGVGDSIYQKIDQIMKTGSCPLYDKIKDIVDPRDALLKVHGIGPKRANELMKMGINTVDELKEKKEYLNEKQKIGLRYYDELNQPIPREEIVKHEKHLKTFLKKTDPNAELTISGSYRRNKAESGDIDVLLKSDKKETYTKFIKKLVNQGYLVEQLALGTKKYNGICRLGRKGSGRRIDIMYTTPSEYPFAILYFTGSGDFNVRMREDALNQGYTMNEYSMKHTKTKEVIETTFLTEREIFDFLGYDYLEPEMRIQ